jgi:hypothetical protein
MGKLMLPLPTERLRLGKGDPPLTLKLEPGPDGSFDHDKLTLEVRQAGALVATLRHADRVLKAPPRRWGRAQIHRADMVFPLLSAYCRAAAHAPEDLSPPPVSQTKRHMVKRLDALLQGTYEVSLALIGALL